MMQAKKITLWTVKFCMCLCVWGVLMVRFPPTSAVDSAQIDLTSPIYWKPCIFFAPKRACSLPQGPHGARGCGETGMNMDSIQCEPLPICLWWDTVDTFRLLFPFPLRNQCNLQLFVNIGMLKRLWHRTVRIRFALYVSLLSILLWKTGGP